MACTRKLAQGMEHRQDFHRAFISHLDQDFKVCCVRVSVCLSAACVSVSLIPCSQVAGQHSTFHHPFELMRCPKTLHANAFDCSVYCNQCLDSLTRPLRFAIFKASPYVLGHLAAISLLFSSIAQRTSSTLPQLYHAATIHQQPLARQTPSFSYTASCIHLSFPKSRYTEEEVKPRSF